MTGVGPEDLADHEAPDFERGSGGAPLVAAQDDPSKRELHARASSLGDTLDDKSALTNWRIDRAMDGVAAKPELAAAVLVAKERSTYTRLREDAISAGRGSFKADLGTAVHSMTDRWETEPEWDPGPPYREALTAYSGEMDRLGLKTQMIECKFVNYTDRTAGTADRLYELTRPLKAPDGSIVPAGQLLIGDTKTGASLEFSIPGYSIQMSTYAGGQLYDVINNCVLPTPPINQDWGIIMHLSVEDATCEAIWVDLEVGRYGANLANEVREWRRNWRRKDGYKVGNTRVEAALLTTTVPEDEPKPRRKRKAAAKKAAPKAKLESPPPEVNDSVLERPEPVAKTIDQRREEIRVRLQKIKDHPEASQWILTRWDKATMVAPAKVTRHAQMDDIEKLVARTEAEYELSF